MKSFKEFLTGTPAFDLDKFKKDCEPYLSFLGGTHGKQMLYRGTHDMPKDFNIAQWKARNGPRDTPLEMHDVINDYFEHKFKVRARDWMFCSGSKRAALMYGPGDACTVIFPIGKFEWLSALNDAANDLAEFFGKVRKYVEHENSKKDLDEYELHDLIAEEMMGQMDNWTWYHNQDIVSCIKTQNEIMFKCDKFYAFNTAGKTFNTQEFKEFLRSI